MDDALYDGLRSDVPEEYDWSEKFCESKTNALVDFAKAYYQQ